MQQQQLNFMMRLLAVLLSMSHVAGDPADHVDLVTFDGGEGTSFSWKDAHYPLMGGISDITFTPQRSAKTARLSGKVGMIGKALKAPGYCNTMTTYSALKPPRFNDPSGFTHLQIHARSSVEYAGYKVSFAADAFIPGQNTYKASFNLPGDGLWHTVSIPFSDFSNDWSPFSGDCGTPDSSGRKHVCCTESTTNVCPTLKNLKDISQFGIWFQGKEGKFDVEIASVSAGFGGPADKPSPSWWPPRTSANNTMVV
eukprot:TRINITY_DN5128_c1_g1_i1.p1 TRINITY_DN5128_c1_g1~~TRINITY_DN5128_c1_g1_i1.p1  ORF type:complete len:254 (+),score=34.90 TRINITY_DN5128_c1_g1_i1:59-820(+)